MRFTSGLFVKTIVLFIALNFLTANIFAQNNLTGSVIDSKDHKPVSGAVVRLKDSFVGTTTDQQGKFFFTKMPEAIYEIVVSHIAFETQTLSIMASSENVITLEPKVYLADEITINATRVDQRSGAAYNNISKEELEKNNLGQDLPVLLSNLPSVVVTSDAGNGVGYTGIRVRGNDPTRVNVTINGIPVNEAESHQVYWVDLPDIASSTDNIQFQRGLGSSTNGAGAFGASINLQTTKISQTPYAGVSSSIGSFNTNKNTVSFGTGILNKHFTIDGRMSMINSDGYIDRATSNLRSFSLSGGYYNDKEFIRAVIISGKEKTYQAWYGISEEQLKEDRTYNPAGEYTDQFGNLRYYENQTDNYQQDYYQLFYSRTLNKKLTANIGLHYTKGEGYYEEFNPLADLSSYGFGSIVIGDSTIDQTDIVRRKWLSTDYYGATWSLDYELNSLELKLGGGIYNYEGRHYNEIISAGIFPASTFPYTYYDDNSTKSDVNVFLKATYSLNDKLTLTGDVQERIVKYNFSKIIPDASNNTDLNFFNPKAGITYKTSSKSRIYFFAGLGHKEPVRDDYLASTPTTRPDAESMIDYEAGYKFTSNKLIAAVNLYYMDYQNQLILTGNINEVGEYIRENVKDSYRRGIELEFGYNISKKLALNANLTLSENKIKIYNEYVYDYDLDGLRMNTYKNSTISFSPAVISSVELTYKPFKPLRFTANTKYVGKQYLDNTGNENSILNSYFLTNFSGNYSPSIKSLKGIEFKLQVNNIFGEMYSSNGYTFSDYSSNQRTDYNYYYPQAGVNWMAGVVVRF
jgi:iron complex outermembrane receptor protein